MWFGSLILSLSSGTVGGVLGLCGTGRGGGAPVPLRHLGDCGFFALPLWQGRQPSVWCSETIAGWLSIAAFNLLYPGTTTPRFVASQTSGPGLLIICCVSSIAAWKNPSLVILATYKARYITDCSSCTQPFWLAILAAMLKTYKQIVAAYRVSIGCYFNHIRLCRLLQGISTLFGPLQRMFINKFVCDNPRIDNIVMFNFVHSAY